MIVALSVAIQLCFLLGKNATKPVLTLKTANKDDALGKTQVYMWFSCFKSSKMKMDDKYHGHPLMSRTDKNNAKIHARRPLLMLDH